MKYVTAFVLSLFALTACATEAPKSKEPAKAEAAVPAASKASAPKTKRVCIKQKDAKTQEEKEVCKNVKVHQKLEGTKVPEKK